MNKSVVLIDNKVEYDTEDDVKVEHLTRLKYSSVESSYITVVLNIYKEQ